MATRNFEAAPPSIPSTAFARLAGLCAFGAALSGFLYSVSFIILKDNLLSGLFLLLSGLLTTGVLTTLYEELIAVNPTLALWGLLLGSLGAVGALVHGGYDLANAINSPGPLPAGVADLPSQIDPRGLLTFGVTALSLLINSWLIQRQYRLPRNLAWLGYGLAALLLVLYLGRLVILDARNLVIVIPALLVGFVLNPAWYIWLGLRLQRDDR